MTPAEVTQLLAVLTAAGLKKTPEVTDSMKKVWAIGLDDVRYEDAMHVAHHYIKHQEWFPSIKNIREPALTRQSGLPDLHEAWRMVQPSKNGPPPPLPYAVLSAYQDIGGSWAIKSSEQPEQLRQQFYKAYYQRLCEALDGVATSNHTSEGASVDSGASYGLTAHVGEESA